MKHQLSRTFPLALMALAFTLTSSAFAQDTETVLFNFQGSSYGNDPGSFVRAANGDIYGTLALGGSSTCGLVYKLSASSGNTVESILHTFTCGDDGSEPASILMDANGNLFVATIAGANTKCLHGCGSIVELSPIKAGGWKTTVLYDFVGGIGGNTPTLTLLDSHGNLYGFASAGPDGQVFEVSPSSSGTWTKKTLYTFKGGSDGGFGYPYVMDASGNIYGAANRGGNTTSCSSGCGLIFQLTPGSNGTWTETVLYSFAGAPDGAMPNSLISDGNGNFFGTTTAGGSGTDSHCTQFTPVGCGTLFELSPSSGGYTESVLHTFNYVLDGYVPEFPAMDSASNLYVPMFGGGVAGGGLVLEFTLGSDGIWEYSTLHSFGGGRGGNIPFLLSVDSSNDVFGITALGGSKSNGVLYELTPAAAAK